MYEKYYIVFTCECARDQVRALQCSVQVFSASSGWRRSGLLLDKSHSLFRNELEDYAEQQQQMAEIKKDRDAKEALDTYARKNHYLLSTVVQPGVFNSPYKP